MSDPYMGTVMPVAFQFAPQDWQTCQGQNLPVNQYSALYSLLGTTFGGSNGQNFNLPDLQGRTIVGQGILNLNGSVSQYVPGAKGGAVNATLSTANVPLAPHVHPVTSSSTTATVSIMGSSGEATLPGPGNGNVLATANYDDPSVFEKKPVSIYAPAGTPTATSIGTGTISLSGLTVGANNPTGATPFSIREPYLVMYYIIATNGIYPTRP
ncbi:tail fiber protein [Skermanella mucosa]|uniref:phage tail protein n=1 Tax=Skermanella mucosa TaxID=1789672 RepID=UPI00192C1F4D|nr:tail fiber protein [Skermanella mucosa]UEM20147.1 tail fiber protein [Skermanella mucosa]